MNTEIETTKKYSLPQSAIVRELLDQVKDIVQGSDNRYHDLENEETWRLMSKDNIKHICLKYRLRFLDIKLLKQEVPIEAKQELQYLESKYGLKFRKLKVIGPGRIFELEEREKDPILIAELDYVH